MPQITPESEPQKTELMVSKDLEIAITDSINILSLDGILEPKDILLAILLNQKCLGFLAIEEAARDNSNFPFTKMIDNIESEQSAINPDNLVEISVKNQKVLCHPSLRSVFEAAGNQAKTGNVIDTGHFVAAELERSDSILSQAIAACHPKDSKTNDLIIAFFEAARKGNYGKERIGSILDYQDAPASKSREERVKRSNNSDNLMEIVRKDGYRKPEVSKNWRLPLLQSVNHNKITVIMSDSPEEVLPLLEGLAVDLVQDTGNMFHISSMIMPDKAALADDFDGVLLQSARRANGGILVVPAESDYLNNRSIRQALDKDMIRIISYTSKQKWMETRKGLGRGLQAFELSLKPLTITEAVQLVSSRIDHYREMYAPLTLTPEAIKCAAALADQYQSALDTTVIPGMIKIFDQAETTIKTENSGMVELHNNVTLVDLSMDVDDTNRAFEDITTIPMTSEDTLKYLQMEETLGMRVIGQEEAIHEISNAVRKDEAGLKDPNRPIGSFIFLGPTGVGKTETAKALAEFLFQNENALIRLDMSEYSEKHTVARMIGAPPGYTGYEDGGQLTEQVRRHPYSIVLFDEMEKAHLEVMNVTLQILDDGRMTDGQGRTVDFRNTVIIMTSNVGSAYYRLLSAFQENADRDIVKATSDYLISEGSDSEFTPLLSELGKDADDATFALASHMIEKMVLEELKNKYPPEFLNRFDEQIAFHSLRLKNGETIVGLQINKVNKKLKEKSLKVVVTEQAQKRLAFEGYDPEMGVRRINRVIQDRVEEPLAMRILRKEFIKGDEIQVDFDGNNWIIQKKSSEK